MKTILITGSTDGIGKLVGLQLAKDGHQIILHGRNPEKLQNTINEIKEATNNTNISGYISDFSDFDSVSKMAAEINNNLDKIDVLINNAGVFKSRIQTNKNGLDLRFAVNYLAPYILTNAVLPLLLESDAPRLVNLSSAAQSPVSLKALAGEESIISQNSYAQSKLALTMWSSYLANKFSDITVIAVNPGSLLNTRMANEAYGQHWSPATKGSNILYDLAVLEQYADASGKYFDNDRGGFNNAHPDAYNADKIHELLTATNRILNA